MKGIAINQKAFKPGQRVFTQLDGVTLCLSADGGESGTYTVGPTKNNPPGSREYRPPTEDEMWQLYDLGLTQFFTVNNDIEDPEHGDDFGQPKGRNEKGGKKRKQGARELQDTEHAEPDPAGDNGQ